MAEQSIVLRYEGPALDDGSMDVRQLAPSLLALGELYQESQRILYPGERPLALEVRATEPGSFKVHLVLTQSLVQQAVELFAGQGATAIANLLAFTTAGAGLVGLLITLHRKRVRSRSELASGMIVIIFEDGTRLEVPREVMQLAESAQVRKALKDVMEPLNADGIEQITLSDPDVDVPTVVIEKRDVKAFDLPPLADEPINDVVQTEVLSIASVAFTDNKWRLTDGERTFYATVADEAFLGRIATDDVSFAKHDLLRVQLNTKQWRTSSGLRTEYTVTRVDEHITAARPIALNLEYVVDEPPEATSTEPRALPPADPTSA